MAELASATCAVCGGPIYENPMTSTPSWAHANLADVKPPATPHDARPADDPEDPE